MRIRRMLQKRGANRQLGHVHGRESSIIRDSDHKINRKIVDIAEKNCTGIVLEDLKNIRNSTQTRKSFKHALNSWSFYQLKTFIEYKAKLRGIPVTYIDPRKYFQDV